MAFAENLKQLPRISHLAAIQLLDSDGAVAATIENKSGQVGSLSIYNHLGQIYGAITVEAAKKGLELYAEHAEDARQNPGKHPNIDRLLEMVAGQHATLRVKHIFAVGPD
ncbi:MAG: DUF2322 family protein [Rhodocyclales bacterium]|nr:DUF2322 family protein [Rhodocyclales bacterium]